MSNVQQFYQLLPMSNQTENENLTVIEKKNLSQKKVVLNLEEWRKCNKHLKAEICWKVQELQLKKNFKQELFREMRPIEYPFLKSLNLSQNKIQTLQPFNLVDFPNLEMLYLNGNLITNFATFKKCCLHEIKYLNISFCFSQEHKQISYLKKCETIVCQYIKVSPIQSQDLRWVGKMETENLKAISVKNLHRIRQKEAKEVLKRRHKDLWIYGK